MLRKIVLFAFLLMIGQFAIAQHNHDDHSHDGHDHSSHEGHDHSSHDHASHKHENHGPACGTPQGVEPEKEKYDAAAVAIHHISDANVINIMDMVRIPLPAIIYNKDRGLEFFSTAKFKAGHHDDGHYGYKDYVMLHGNIHRIKCPGFADMNKYEVQGFNAVTHTGSNGKDHDTYYAIVGDKAYEVEAKTIWDGGLLGGAVTSFYDLSPTKNVVTMIIVCLLLFFFFRRAAKSYVINEGKAPSGVQSFLEPLVQFIRDDVGIPFIGKDKYEKYMPLLLTVFFFILGLNLWGQIPFLGSVNVTGTLTITMILAIIVFFVTNLNGNKHYWEHTLWMPGVPPLVKALILTPVEIMGLFIKPLTLMLRLAGNITAGHIALVSFVGLIFIFGESGKNMTGSIVGTTLAVPLTMFMMAIELIVAFVQAFVFAILTASYIGAAVEDHDHH